jgi:HD-GYP domain-containing protein (c-di-GMP phosphodiesterase class II)
VPLLDTLTRALDAQDPDATRHASRVAAFAEILARRLGWRDFETLRLGGAVHDLGKLAVPRRVLMKRTALTAAELARVREHPGAGARLLAPIIGVRPALPYVLFHLAVVDAFDAMTSDRPYRRALPAEAAVEEVDRCAGGQFDPVVARAFVGAWLEGEFRLPVRRAVA